MSAARYEYAVDLTQGGLDVGDVLEVLEIT